MSSDRKYGSPSGANNSTIEYAENAEISGVSGKKIFNVDSTGNLIDETMASMIIVSDPYTYIAYAAAGSSQSDSVWRVKRIESSGQNKIITWADGDAKFDNSATDLTSLSYA